MSEEKDQFPETSDGRSRRNRKDINYKKFHEGRLSDSDGDTEYESSHDMGENVQYEVYDDPSEELESMRKEIQALDDEKALLQKCSVLVFCFSITTVITLSVTLFNFVG